MMMISISTNISIELIQSLSSIIISITSLSNACLIIMMIITIYYDSSLSNCYDVITIAHTVMSIPISSTYLSISHNTTCNLIASIGPHISYSKIITNPSIYEAFIYLVLIPCFDVILSSIPH